MHRKNHSSALEITTIQFPKRRFKNVGAYLAFGFGVPLLSADTGHKTKLIDVECRRELVDTAKALADSCPTDFVYCARSQFDTAHFFFLPSKAVVEGIMEHFGLKQDAVGFIFDFVDDAPERAANDPRQPKDSAEEPSKRTGRQR